MDPLANHLNGAPACSPTSQTCPQAGIAAERARAMSLTRRQWIEISAQSFCAFAILALGARPATALVAHAPPIDYPERPVREFLKIHFEGSRKFSPSGLDGKERLLTRRFRQKLYKFFERSAKSKDAPPMVNDPFTGSQGATSFSVGDGKVRVEKAWVPVTFTDGRNQWTITYLLRNDQERNDERWRIDDIQDVRGMLLSEVLK